MPSMMSFSSLLDIGKLIHLLLVEQINECFSSLLDIGKLIQPTGYIALVRCFSSLLDIVTN